MRRALAATLLVLLAGRAGAAGVPVAGRVASLRADGPAARRAHVVLRDPAIVTPLPDPRTGPLRLVVNGGAAVGQCTVVLTTDPTFWRELRRGGAVVGYRHGAGDPQAPAIRRILLREGRIDIRARGAAWPCDLAGAQRLPLAVTLRVGGTRYCAAFGGTVADNRPGRFRATDAGRPPVCEGVKDDLTVATLNILHGFSCPPATASCRLSERLDLLFQFVVARGCPDVVTLQEVSDASVPLISSHLAGSCPFPYHAGYERLFGLDDVFVLSRYPIDSIGNVALFNNFRHVSITRIDHPLGPVAVFSTHLASGSDGAQLPCGGNCPPECVAAGAATVRQCQGVQVANLVAARHDLPTPAVVTGDFNDEPGSFVYQQLTNGGRVDAYLAAGNPECNPGTGLGCTSGRDDATLTQLESPVSNEVERIDYIFVVPSTVPACTIEVAGDPDGDGTATRHFADVPNPFGPSCGPAPDPICWPSDHEGVQLDLACG